MFILVLSKVNRFNLSSFTDVKCEVFSNVIVMHMFKAKYLFLFTPLLTSLRESLTLLSFIYKQT